jgi:Na+/alanine symporter
MGGLGSGDTTAWPMAIASLIIFVISTPCAMYYYGRRNTQSLSEKERKAIELATMESKKDAKKQ